MRNLKRVLSLTLASVMLLGMMVVGANAAEVKKIAFADADSIDYTEAVEVMVALEVLQGSGKNFNPKEILTREQAAKIICHMLLGAENAEKLTTNEVIFKDVAAGRWSAGYIAYCARLGILSGVGGGNFDPAGQLTGVQFGKMLLVSLGYDPKIQKYTGSNWAISVGKDMIEAGIDVEGTILSAPLTREQAAQMAYQTLEADMVKYDFTLQGYLTGVQTPEAVGSDDTVDYDSSTDSIQQFCEKYFPDLEKDDVTNDFGRPVDEWTLDGDTIGKYVNKTPAVTFTTKQDADDVAKALKNYKLGAYKVENNNDRTISDTTDDVLVANGAAATSLGVSSETIAKAIADKTGNGVCVEIYANNKKEITSIVTLTYTVEEVTSAVERKDGDYTRTDYGMSQSGGLTAYTDPDKDDDTTAVAHADLERDDVVVTLALDNGKTHIYLAEQVNGVQSSYNSGKKTIRVDGKDYTVGTDVSKTLTISGGAITARTTLTFNDTDSKFNENSKDEITLYLDLYGNVVKKDAVASKDYAVIAAIRWTENTTDLDDGGAATARLIFADGSTEVVTLNEMTYSGYKNKFKKDTTPGLSTSASTEHKVDVETRGNSEVYAGLIVTYTKANNGKYNVTVQNTKIDNANVATGTAGKKVVTNKVPALQDDTNNYIRAITGNSATVYIVKSKSGNDTIYNSYTGYRNVPSIEMSSGNSAKVSYVADTGTVAKYIFIDATAGSNIGDKKSGDIVYIFDENNLRTNDSGSDITYFYQKVVLNGVLVDEIEVEDTDIFTAPGFYEVGRDDDGVVTGLTDDPAFVGDNVNGDAGKGILKTDIYSFTYDEKDSSAQTVYVIDVDREYAYEGVAESAQDDDVIWVDTKSDSSTSADRWAIKTAYVIKGGSAIVRTASATCTTATPNFTNKTAHGGKVAPTADITVSTPTGEDSKANGGGTIALTVKSGNQTLTTEDTVSFTLTTAGSVAIASAPVTGVELNGKTVTLTYGGTAWPTSFGIEVTNGGNKCTYTVTTTAASTNISASSSALAFSGSTGSLTSTNGPTFGAGTDGEDAISIASAGTTPANGDTLTFTLTVSDGTTIASEAAGTATKTFTFTYNATESDWGESQTVKLVAPAGNTVTYTISAT